MALTFEDVRDKVFVGMGVVIVAGLGILLAGMGTMKNKIASLEAKMASMPDIEALARSAYDSERLSDRITSILTTQTEMRITLEKLAQYQREVQIKSLEDQRAVQVQLQTLTTQFGMWRELERKRIQNEGGYDPEKRTYNVDESVPHRPSLNNPTKTAE